MAKSPNPYPLRKKPYPPSREPIREPYCNDDAGGLSVTVHHSPTEFRGGNIHHQETAARQQAWSQARSSALRIRPSTVPFSTLWTVFQSMSPPRSSTLRVFR